MCPPATPQEKQDQTDKLKMMVGGLAVTCVGLVIATAVLASNRNSGCDDANKAVTQPEPAPTPEMTPVEPVTAPVPGTVDEPSVELAAPSGGAAITDDEFSFLNNKLLSNFYTTLEDNTCAGSKLPLSNAACTELGVPQAAANVTKGYVGGMDVSTMGIDGTPVVPNTKPYYQSGMCPVNVHWHLGTEHYSYGEYDEKGDGPHGTIALAAPATDGAVVEVEATEFSFLNNKMLSGFYTVLEDNTCAGSKLPLDNAACTELGVPQAAANITKGFVGKMDVSAAGKDGTAIVPNTKPYYQSGMCPVNVHWHLGSEHYSYGEFDEKGDGPHGNVARPDWATRGLASAEVDDGFRCHHYDAADEKFTTPYEWQYCEGMEVGETYEVHWPHSAAGACGTADQYQTPFYDGVFCNLDAASFTNVVATAGGQGVANAVGVHGQVFTIVNDEAFFYGDMIRGMLTGGDMGTDIAYYTGSTTGDSRDNELCSAYSPITWQVDRKCHMISASSFDKMCYDMKMKRDDMSGDLHAHGSRTLVNDKWVANNQYEPAAAAAPAVEEAAAAPAEPANPAVEEPAPVAEVASAAEVEAAVAEAAPAADSAAAEPFQRNLQAEASFLEDKLQSNFYNKLEDNACAGAKLAFDNQLCTSLNVPQAGAIITKGYAGKMDMGELTPQTNPYFQSSMCPVNVHWHLGTEHYSEGEFDENGDGPHGNQPVPEWMNRNLAEGEVRDGFRCHHYDAADEKFTKPYEWKHCEGMEVGETYEVHWPHSAAGSCGTMNQYQTPFYDGVFCNLDQDGFDNLIATAGAQGVASAVGVHGQVFTIVNDEEYYYGDMINGMIVDKEKGKDVTIYTGSTTGESRNNELCSAYAPVTWQVDRKCHMISASSFDKMCYDMKMQRDDMSGDLHPHGSRELVHHDYAANNQQFNGDRTLEVVNENAEPVAKKAGLPEWAQRTLASAEVRDGFRCHHYDEADEKFTTPYEWKYCEGMEVGETYEVHWPHSAAGACGTVNQYQTPFYDGVFCNLPQSAFENVLATAGAQGVAGAVGVHGQVFTIVNDESYFYADMIRGMVVDGEMGQDIAYYTGSTTGDSRDNEVCSAYSPITWQVDRKCHMISASSFDKMCYDMKMQRDDMSGDLHAHGSRELVADEWVANNQANRDLQVEASFMEDKAQSDFYNKLEDNACAGAKLALDNQLCTSLNVPQAGAIITKGYAGKMDMATAGKDGVPLTPQTNPYFQSSMCPVNVHWHLGTEHYSEGEFDEGGNGPHGNEPIPDWLNRNLATGEVRDGFRCHHYDEADEKFTTPYEWKHCEGMEVGETYEVHWPHSAAGACGTVNQYQTPFYDGVFCNLDQSGFENLLATAGAQGIASAVGVHGQVFTIVNDEEYYYGDMIRGMIVDKDMGVDVTIYTGSTTGESRNNELCSAYAPVTWQVDRKCHMISASSFDKMCYDMKMQRDDMSGDLHPHGSRELVHHDYAANNQQFNGDRKKKFLRA